MCGRAHALGQVKRRRFGAFAHPKPRGALADLRLGRIDPATSAVDHKVPSRALPPVSQIARLSPVVDFENIRFAGKLEAYAGGNARHLARIHRQPKAFWPRIAARIGHSFSTGPGATAKKGLGLLGSLEVAPHAENS